MVWTTSIGVRMRRVISTAAVAASLVSALVIGVTPANAAGNATTITGGGSSFQDDFTTKCAAKFSAKSGKSVTYTKSSSGTGRSNFSAGSIDFAGSDSYKAVAGGVYIPISGAPIAFFANVGGLKTLKLDPATVSKIYNGEITTWNDGAIAALNKGVNLPATAISPLYRSGTSGTTYALTNWFQQVVGGAWQGSDDFGAGLGKSPVGTSAANSAALVSAAVGTAGAIGYADLSDAAGQKALTLVTLKNNAGQWIKPSVAAAAKALNAQKTPNGEGFVEIQYKRGTSGGYDLVSYTYMIAPTGKGTDAAKLVKEYATFVVNTCMPNPKSIGAGNYAGISKSSVVGKKAVAQLAKIG